MSVALRSATGLLTALEVVEHGLLAGVPSAGA
ncbi:MAG: hypothetical protein QOF58_4500, partial [Pseudonocardiales bacterium]|nr:hypothetical protein [Pseudonocardiales bacterium]